MIISEMLVAWLVTTILLIVGVAILVFKIGLAFVAMAAFGFVLTPMLGVVACLIGFAMTALCIVGLMNGIDLFG